MVAIAAVTGPPGMGKTALALHWAHRRAGGFPDGQLYVNLRGFHPSGTALSPAVALRGFLTALGAAPPDLPAETEGLTAEFRSLVAGRRVLLVLDNARDAEQVRPLLPGSSTSTVLVTSRNQLLGLVAADGAQPVPLDLLADEDARELLAQRIGRGRTEAEQPAARELVTMAAGLPLALSLLAAEAATRPSRPLAALVERLRGEGQGVAALADGDHATDLSAVFSWSYLALSPTAATLFRLLALHPGPELDVAAATSLTGCPARPALDELCRVHLLSEVRPGRFVVHDLLFAYAREVGRRPELAQERRAATRRLLEHYLHTARRASRLPGAHRPLADVAPGGVVPSA